MRSASHSPRASGSVKSGIERFHDAFNAKYAEIRELEKRDTKDNEYAIAKQEAALKAACGKYYSPREVRYDIKIVTRDGKQHKL